MEPRRKRCYNSGKISGLSYQRAKEKFSFADSQISGMGLLPVSPIYNGLKPSYPWIAHIIVDLFILSACGNIFLQSDWKESRGARIEYRFSKLLGIKTWFQEDIQ